MMLNSDDLSQEDYDSSSFESEEKKVSQSVRSNENHEASH